MLNFQSNCDNNESILKVIFNLQLNRCARYESKPVGRNKQLCVR